MSRRIWYWRWFILKERIAFAWHHRRALLDQARRRIVGEEVFQERTIDTGDGFCLKQEIAEIFIAEGLFGWKRTGITRIRSTDLCDMSGTLIETFTYRGKRYATFVEVRTEYFRDEAMFGDHARIN